MDVPDVFHSQYQTHPLDMYSEAFYPNRQTAIDERLKQIAESSEEVCISYSSAPENILLVLFMDSSTLFSKPDPSGLYELSWLLSLLSHFVNLNIFAGFARQFWFMEWWCPSNINILVNLLLLSLSWLWNPTIPSVAVSYWLLQNCCRNSSKTWLEACLYIVLNGI